MHNDPIHNRLREHPLRKAFWDLCCRFAPEILGTLLLISFGMVLLFSMSLKTPTWDEPTHYSFGARMLEKGSQSQVTLSSMAISQLNVVPNFYLRGDRVHYPKTVEAVFASRVPTVLAAVLLGAVLFAFARRLYGRWAGFGALVVFCLSPTILAHSRWVTNDVFCSLFMVSTLYTFWRYLETRGWGWLFLCGGLFGAAQVSKFTSLLLFPILGLLWLVFFFVTRRKGAVAEQIPNHEEKEEEQKDSSRQGTRVFVAVLWGKVSRFVVFVVTAWVVWNSAYYFQKTFVSWRSTRFQSGFMKGVQKVLGPLPTLLPSPYLGALDVTFHINSVHSGRGLIYLLGKTSRQGFRHYFLVALAFKVPLGFWLLFFFALVSLWPHKKSTGPPSFRVSDLLLLVPVIFLGVYFVFFCTAQIGVRYLMPLLVLLHIFTGRLWFFSEGGKNSKDRIRRGFIAVAVVFMGWSSLSYYPHFLSYFNELVFDKRLSYRILADSNLDWKQNKRYVKDYMRRHGLSRSHLNPKRPAVGTWVVSANRLVGVHHPNEYRWLRGLEPKRHVCYSHFLFRVSTGDLRKVLSFQKGKMLQASTVKRRDLVFGLWREAYQGTKLKGKPCSKRRVRRLNVARVCGRRDGFSAKFKGFLKIPHTGEYLLSLGSDDGGRLFLNDHLLIDLWGDHGLVFDHVIVQLEKGFHPLEVHFYENWGDAKLRLRLSTFPQRRCLSPRRLFFTKIAW